MKHHLIVVHAFGDYAKGDHITDAGAVEALASSPHVVRVAAPVEKDAE